MELTKEQIDKIFKESENQAEVMISLYKAVIPNWDDVKEIEGWPTIGEKGGEYITLKFREFDRAHHPNVYAGGYWMNSGFSMYENKNIRDWEVDLSTCTIKRKETNND